MVDDDDLEAELARLQQRLVAGGAAIDGDEQACDLVHLDPATGENARQQLGHVLVALCDGERARRAPLVEPIAPGASAGRALDPEKEAPRRAGRCRQGDCHLRSRESRQKSLRYWMKPERST